MDTVTQQIRELRRTRNRPAPVEPFVLDESLYPIEQENQLIDYFRKHYTDNPKRMRKLVADCYHRVPSFIQKSFMNQLLEAKDICKGLCMYFAEKERWTEIINQMIAEGNHGVIYNDKEVFGFSIEANAKWLRENDKWCMDDEKEIIKKSYYKHCRERGLKHFEGKVMMFHHFGFSGMSYFFNHPIDDSEGY